MEDAVLELLVTAYQSTCLCLAITMLLEHFLKEPL